MIWLKSHSQKITSKITIYFKGKSHFEEDCTQNYLVFQLMYKYFKRFVHSGYLSEWKSKRLADESITSPSAPNNFPNPKLL